MKAYRRFSTVRQMAVSVAVFAALGLVLESGGLYDWAQRLELGPERTVAVPVTTALHRGLRHVGLERARHGVLLGLARRGWSDDAALIAEAHGGQVSPIVVGPVAMKRVVPTSAVVVAADDKVPTTGAPPKTPDLALQPLAGDPPIVNALPSLAAVEAGKVRTVALVGDSMMAVGLSSTILREAPQYKSLNFVKVFKSGTGLARPEVFDWQVEYPAMLKTTSLKLAAPDVIVVAIGANDGQGFVEDGKTYIFGTPEWQDIYERRVQAFLGLLEEDGARVVWVGLPPMKSGTYDARIALVNRIDYAVVSASPQAIWFSSAGLVGDAKGRFQDFGTVRGATARLRQADGIHLSDDGAALLTAKLLPWLGKQVPAPLPVAPAPAVKETASAGAGPVGVDPKP
jgi:hypothetical protein